jgi:hypothetical protein
MKNYAYTDNLAEMRSEDREQLNQYCNVQFLSKELNGAHRLKIRDKSSKSMCFQVKESSDILPRLKMGDELEMIYYPTQSRYPCVYLEAVVRHITKRNQGSPKGSYLVGLEALKRQN